MVKQGDIIFTNFSPQAGSEQSGLRPALVISAQNYHDTRAKRAIVCPITSTDRKLPIHVKLDARTRTHGFIMCDHLKSIDLHARGCRYIETAPRDVVEFVLDIIADFMDM